MDVAIVSSKKTKTITRFAGAFKRNGFSKAVFLNAKHLILISKGGKTFVSEHKKDLSYYDSVLLLLEPSLAPLAEPLLSEIEKQKIFCNVSPNSYYTCGNELLQLVQLEIADCKTTKSVMAMDASAVSSHIADIHTPVVFKSYSANKKTQTVVVETEKTLRSLLKSSKVQLDGVLVKELIDADLIECLVVGQEVFGLLRKWNGIENVSLAKARPAVLTEWEKERAVQAANACNCTIATVRMSKGFVTRVSPKADFLAFNQKIGVDVFDAIAKFYKDSLESKPARRKEGGFLDKLVRALEEWFYGRR